MDESKNTEWLRRFLLGVIAAIFIGSILELILLEHYEESLQYIPFIVSGMGLITVATAWVNPTTTILHMFRWMMGIVVVTSLAGMYFHFTSNLSFAREMNPSLTFWQLIWPAIKGAHPLLAPGILLLAGVLGFGATYRHPQLRKE